MNGVVNSQFTPQSTIYLLKGLEIDAMNNTFWGAFDTPENQFSFFMDNYDHIEFNDYTYQRKDGTVVVTGSYDDLRLYNYLIYRNGNVGNKSKYIYCFITSLGYLNEKATSITFETDVIQTWRFEIERNFLPSFIAYEHRPQWYKDTSIDDNQRPCINTQPENLEIGTDLVSDKQYFMRITNNTSYAIIAMTSDLNGSDSYSFGVLGSPSQLNYYVIPFNTLTGLDIKTINIDGQATTISGLSEIMDAIRKDEKLVGKCVSITINNSLCGITYNNGVPNFKSKYYLKHDYDKFSAISVSLSTYNSMISNNDDDYITYNLNGSIDSFIGFNRFTKLYTYPYSYILLSDNNGTSKVFKNELWKDPRDIQFISIGCPSSSKINIIPKNYKVNNDNTHSSLINLDNSFETSYELSVPVISDATAMMMQSSRNSMNVGLSNIRRSNETASAIASATGNAMSAQTNLQNNLNLSVTSRNANLASNLTDLQNKSNMINSSLNAVSSLSGGIASVLTGDIGGGISSLAGSGLGLAQSAIQNQINTQQTNMQNANALANASAQASASSQSTAIGNALRNLATSYQNTTNIQNAVDSYNAKIHDAQATSDSIVSGSNDLLRVQALDLSTLVLYAYKPTQEYIDKLNQIWNMRGYATNTIDYPNLHSKFLWNYVQTVKCDISGDGIDPSDLEKIKRVFDNGITLWHDKHIGDYSRNNGERYQTTECDKFGNYIEKKVH
ncbi:MAG: hypothetical protein SPF22_05725 [Candidatus Onthovivens sp.]|nr:hypothetical protein [Candidatus Onthovivens sp.]